MWFLSSHIQRMCDVGIDFQRKWPASLLVEKIIFSCSLSYGDHAYTMQAKKKEEEEGNIKNTI